jgi:hypothetical protein
MTVFVCKTCGRALRAEEKPNFCYYDRMNSIENISDEDAIKMGLFSLSKGEEVDGIIYEFLADLKFHPFTGEAISELGLCGGLSLSDFQDQVMKRVIK